MYWNANERTSRQGEKDEAYTKVIYEPRMKHHREGSLEGGCVQSLTKRGLSVWKWNSGWEESIAMLAREYCRGRLGRASSLPPPRKYPESPFQTLPSRLRDGLKISQVPKSSRRFLLFPTICPLPSQALLSALIPPYPPPSPPPLLLPSTPGPYPTDYLCGLTSGSIERAVFCCISRAVCQTLSMIQTDAPFSESARTPRYLNAVAHLSISNIRTLPQTCYLCTFLFLKSCELGSPCYDVFDNHIVQLILFNYAVVATYSMHNFSSSFLAWFFGFVGSSRRHLEAP
ncbi:hypothetical protein B0H11DRAFT_2208824 [Mycena galericulata]|nr:hypothetical protein B0H11DRAFT_2208824 [Mycena galericulata]